MATPLSAERTLPALVIALGLIPFAGSLSRLATLVEPGLAAAGDARFLDAPLPIALHAGGGAVMLVLAALQVAPRFRSRHLDWHRGAGRALVAAIILFAVGGLWMVATYPRQPAGSPGLSLLRLAVGGALLALVLRGWLRARARDIRGHRRDMIRVLALFMAAGTFVPLWFGGLALGMTDGPTAFLAVQALSFAVNIALAETLLARS